MEIKYFRSRYPQVYKKIGNEFPYPNQIKAFKNGRDVAAPVQKEFDERYGDSDPTWYKQDYLDMINYQLLPNKIEFEPLTLEIARRNIGKKIHFYYANGDDPTDPLFGPSTIPEVDKRNDRNVVFYDWVIIPNGDLFYDNRVYKNWLNHQDSFLIKPKMFLYLPAITSFDELSDQEIQHMTRFTSEMQISDPLTEGPYKGRRVLSGNVANGLNWVEKGVY